ncbi:MAG TPA: DOMON-like domain-containing protein [Candidatus Binatia bacterium]|nr:DOMON-like domain-containing protein [Candidatus Binatia bacterium]
MTSTPVRRIEACVHRAPDGGLAVAFDLLGDLDALHIPAMRPPRIANRLWEHTCFEVFIAADGSETYHEFNLSPSGEWMAHAFRHYRDGGPLADEALDPRIAVRRLDHLLELSATVQLDRLSAGYAAQPLQLGLSAVIEHIHGSLSYWALRHPAGQPDFHHRDSFVLRLPGAGVDAGGNPR